MTSAKLRLALALMILCGGSAHAKPRAGPSDLKIVSRQQDDLDIWHLTGLLAGRARAATPRPTTSLTWRADCRQRVVSIDAWSGSPPPPEAGAGWKTAALGSAGAPLLAAACGRTTLADAAPIASSAASRQPFSRASRSAASTGEGRMQPASDLPALPAFVAATPRRSAGLSVARYAVQISASKFPRLARQDLAAGQTILAGRLILQATVQPTSGGLFRALLLASDEADADAACRLLKASGRSCWVHAFKPPV